MANSTTDPFANQHQFYDTQYAAITATFQGKDDEQPDWRKLNLQLDEALSDPYLPRWYRAEYHILRVVSSREPELHLGWARETIDDMVQILQSEGRTPEQIDARLQPLRGLMATALVTLEEKKQYKEKRALQEKEKAEAAAQADVSKPDKEDPDE